MKGGGCVVEVLLELVSSWDEAAMEDSLHRRAVYGLRLGVAK